MDYVDRILIERTKSGDQLAFAELVESYKDRIYNYLYRLTGSSEDALDLAQETFLRVYSKIDTFDTALRFSPWIYRIAQNAAVDMLRKRRPLVYLDAGLGESDDQWELQIESPTAGPEERVQLSSLKECIEGQLQKLPLQYRSVLLLRYVQELSYEDIARAMDLPVTTVKTRLHRARVGLRKGLEAEGLLED